MWSLLLAAVGQVWTVDDDGPADFATIGEAVEAAADGDSILVRAGLFGSWAIDGKSLSVFFEPGAVSGVVAVTDLARSQRLLLQGMTASGRLILGSCAGNVWLEDCAINAFAACGITNCESVVIVDSTIDSDVASLPFLPSPGAVVSNSTVHVYDSTFRGAVGVGGSHALFCDEGLADGGHGMRVDSGFVFASGCTFEGGPGGFGDDQGLLFNGEGTDGGAGIELQVGATLELVACQLIGGPAGAGTPGCADGMEGLPLEDHGGTVAQSRGVARALVGPGVLREGDVADLVFAGEAGDFVFGLASTSASPLAVPGFVGPLHVNFPWALVSLGALPPGGQLLVQLPIGDLPPGVLFLTRYLQPVMVASSGAPFYLGAPAAFTVLDGSF